MSDTNVGGGDENPENAKQQEQEQPGTSKDAKRASNAGGGGNKPQDGNGNGNGNGGKDGKDGDQGKGDDGDENGSVSNKLYAWRISRSLVMFFVGSSMAWEFAGVILIPSLEKIR